MNIKTGVGEWISLDTGLEQGSREFVIGDIHGHGFELGELLTCMYDQSHGKLGDASLNFTGDIIDRGPCSLGALRLAGAAEQKFGFKSSHMILGNHEIMMVGSLGLIRGMSIEDIKEIYKLWVINGGDRFMDEIDQRLPNRFPCHTTGEFRTLVEDAVGKQAINYILSGDTHRIVGNLLFCHAGIDPNADLNQWFSTPPWPITDEKMSWAWARENFYGHEGQFPNNLIVVHGHTPELVIQAWKGRVNERKDRFGVPIPVNLVNVAHPDGYRIGLDGGSYATGIVMGAEFIPGGYRNYFAWNPDMNIKGRVLVQLPQIENMVH